MTDQGTDGGSDIVFGSHEPHAAPYSARARRPHHNDMVLMRDAQELARDEARQGFYRDLVLLTLICLPTLMVIVFLAGAGLSAAGAFLLRSDCWAKYSLSWATRDPILGQHRAPGEPGAKDD